MMKIFLLCLVLLAGSMLAWRYMSTQPPLRGLVHVSDGSTPALCSRARPVVVLAPAREMRFLTAGWRDIRPATRRSEPGNARIWFALYRNAGATLVTALAEAEEPWKWEAAWHAPGPAAPLRQQQEERGGKTFYETIRILANDVNPFLMDDAGDGPCLVYRTKLLLHFSNMQVLAEYHEPIDRQKARDVAFDLPLLNAFQQRARAACDILFPEKSELPSLTQGIVAMQPADAHFSRRVLSRWAGEMQHVKDL